MRRYFSHYTFIYPEIYLKNYIVEVDDQSCITAVFPYSKEIEKTEFYSGWIMFIPQDIKEHLIKKPNEISDIEFKTLDEYKTDLTILSRTSYRVLIND